MAKITLTPADIKAVKRINQRLVQLENSGFKGSAFYNQFVSRIETTGLQMSKSKGGKIRLSTAKSQTAPPNRYTIAENLARIEKFPTLRDEMARARKEGKEYQPLSNRKMRGKTEAEIAKIRIMEHYDFKERLEQHLQDMYEDFERGNMYGEMLRNLTKSEGLRSQTYAELNKLMNQIDRTRKKLAREQVPYQTSLLEEQENYDSKIPRGRGIPSGWESAHKKNWAR